MIKDPFAGLYAEDLDELTAIGEEPGGLLGERAVAANCLNACRTGGDATEALAKAHETNPFIPAPLLSPGPSRRAQAGDCVAHGSEQEALIYVKYNLGAWKSVSGLWRMGHASRPCS